MDKNMIDYSLIKDDLYEAVNAKYLSELEIPGDKTSIGAFAQIDINIEETLLNDFANLKFYRSIVNNKNRDLSENHKVYEMINKILNIKNKEDLNNVLIDLAANNLPSLFGQEIFASFKDATLNILYLDVCGNILPSKEYYLEAEKKEKLLSVYKEVMLEILNIFKIENSENIVKNALELDERVVEYVKSSEELADYTKLYNKRPLNEIVEYSNLIDFEGFLKHFFNKELDEISITQPRFFENLNNIFTLDDIEKIKHYLLVRFLFNISDLFDEKLRHLKAKYENSISGILEVKVIEKFAYKKAMELFSQVVGIYCGQKYFGEEAKKDIYRLVNNVIDMYKERLANNPWLQQKTKDKAILKLSTITTLMAYPDKLPEVYNLMSYDENLSLYENYFNNLKHHVSDSLAKYKEPVDHTLWGMPACMVNAYYSASSNSICFPAAILNEPFYSLNQTESENYGGIGAVIAHEISHAFDNNGANFDEKGNMNNWWEEEDFKKFKELTNKMIEQFDGIEIYGGKTNGTLIVSENLADVGGMACSLACLKRQENYNLEEFYINWARVWAFKARKEYEELLLKVDVHAPTKLRANIQPQNTDDFYTTFNVTENDKMYLPKEKRITVW